MKLPMVASTIFMNDLSAGDVRLVRDFQLFVMPDTELSHERTSGGGRSIIGKMKNAANQLYERLLPAVIFEGLCLSCCCCCGGLRAFYPRQRYPSWTTHSGQRTPNGSRDGRWWIAGPVLSAGIEEEASSGRFSVLLLCNASALCSCHTADVCSMPYTVAAFSTGDWSGHSLLVEMTLTRQLIQHTTRLY